jgi:ribosomal protein S20
MNRSRKLKIVGAVVAALAVAGGGAAIAATKPWSPHEESQAVIDDAAKQLGVTPSALSNALKKALENRVDRAVADGLLTKQQGAELKQRIESGGVPLGFRPFGLRPFARDHGFPGPFAAKFRAAASYLDLSESELESRLAQGKTLAQIAEDRGKSVHGLVDALVKAAERRIDAAVDRGNLTKSQADDLKSGLRDRTTRLVNGQAFGLHHFFRPGFGFRRPGFLPARPPFWHDFWPRPRGSD